MHSSVTSLINIGGRPANDGGPSVVIISLPQILIFVTGADSIPPMGFPTDPVIIFSKDKSRLLPLSSTCSLSLTLSTGHVEYDMFKKSMDTAVLNAYEFGQV